MNDMSPTAEADSTQVNADDLFSGPRTITVTKVKITDDKKQPVHISFEGSDKLFRPCRTMRRLIIHAWGADANMYEGRSMTLYRDPSVIYGGKALGGVRISHMSHIDGEFTVMLTATNKTKSAHTIKPLVTPKTKPTPPPTDAPAADPVKAMYQSIVALYKSMGKTVQDVNDEIARAGFGGTKKPDLEWMQGLYARAQEAKAERDALQNEEPEQGSLY